MKAQKIKPSNPEDWVPPPKPVIDGPHRQFWKEHCPNLYLRGHPGTSCFHSSMGADGSGTDRDIDANGGYSNVIRAIEA